jgi:hypothetical protein
MLEGTKTNIDDKAKQRVIVGRKATGPKFRDRQVAEAGIILWGRCSVLKWGPFL